MAPICFCSARFCWWLSLRRRRLRSYRIVALALIQGTLILLIGMDLRHDVALIRLFAGIGGFWLTILLTLSLFDYLTR
jgi:caa(3)-type oxidase subunit IV